MDGYYTQTIWHINYVLFVLSVVVSAMLVCYRLMKEKAEGRRRRRIQEIQNDLQSMVGLSADQAAMSRCVSLMKTIAPAELFEVVHNKATAPLVLSKELSLCVHSPERDELSEKIARRCRNKWQRIKALLVIGQLGSPNALEILSEALESKDADIAYFSLLALSQIKNAASASILFDAFRKRIASGYKVAAILEDFPEEEVEKLLPYLSDRDASVRAWALKIIGRRRVAARHLSEIVGLTGDHNADVRAAAYECLGNIGDFSVSATLEKGLKDSEWFVRLHALRALEKAGIENTLPSVVALLGDANWHIQEEAKNIVIKRPEGAMMCVEAFISGALPGAKAHCLEILQQTGCVIKILRDAMNEDGATHGKGMQLLKALLEAGAHFSLEEAMAELTQQEREKALQRIDALDAGKAAHIRMKLQNNLCEP